MRDHTFNNVRCRRTALAAAGALVLVLTWTACSKEQADPPYRAGPQPKAAQAAGAAQPGAEQAGEAARLLEKAKLVFMGPLPARTDAQSPATEEQIALGRMLYFDTRLSKAQDISCNSCHDVTAYGIDVRAPEGQRQVSTGHQGQKGDRNSPTVYNAGLHFRQFWDGRAADLVEQAKGPVLNPVEMAMDSEEAVVAVLAGIPGYVEAFGKAFPGQDSPVTYENMARAIAAFEAGLVTPSRFDDFLAGNTEALNEQELRGLGAFMDSGCIACHLGPALGGTLYQKLGLLVPYETTDTGRHRETKVEADRFLFKVPSLRNIAETAPYLHDGSVATLEEVTQIMAKHQTASGALSDEQVADMVAFLNSLTGELPQAYIAAPELPPSGS